MADHVWFWSVWKPPCLSCTTRASWLRLPRFWACCLVNDCSKSGHALKESVVCVHVGSFGFRIKQSPLPPPHIGSILRNMSRAFRGGDWRRPYRPTVDVGAYRHGNHGFVDCGGGQGGWHQAVGLGRIRLGVGNLKWLRVTHEGEAAPLTLHPFRYLPLQLLHLLFLLNTISPSLSLHQHHSPSTTLRHRLGPSTVVFYSF